MKSKHTGVGAALLIALVMAACQDTTSMDQVGQGGWSHYGFDGRNAGPEIALGVIKGGESNVVTRGTIVEVCPKKGCWMTVEAGGQELFARFQDYAFFVPMNAASHEVVMHGTAQAQVTTVEELRHYAQDSGKSPAEIAAITEPQTRVIFFADSVFIEGDGLDEPWGQ
jgi:hypothetical protein